MRATWPRIVAVVSFIAAMIAAIALPLTLGLESDDWKPDVPVPPSVSRSTVVAPPFAPPGSSASGGLRYRAGSGPGAAGESTAAGLLPSSFGAGSLDGAATSPERRSSQPVRSRVGAPQAPPREPSPPPPPPPAPPSPPPSPPPAPPGGAPGASPAVEPTPVPASPPPAAVAKPALQNPVSGGADGSDRGKGKSKGKEKPKQHPPPPVPASPSPAATVAPPPPSGDGDDECEAGDDTNAQGDDADGNDKGRDKDKDHDKGKGHGK